MRSEHEDEFESDSDSDCDNGDEARIDAKVWSQMPLPAARLHSKDGMKTVEILRKAMAEKYKTEVHAPLYDEKGEIIGRKQDKSDKADQSSSKAITAEKLKAADSLTGVVKKGDADPHAPSIKALDPVTLASLKALRKKALAESHRQGITPPELLDQLHRNNEFVVEAKMAILAEKSERLASALMDKIDKKVEEAEQT